MNIKFSVVFLAFFLSAGMTDISASDGGKRLPALHSFVDPWNGESILRDALNTFEREIEGECSSRARAMREAQCGELLVHFYKTSSNREKYNLFFQRFRKLKHANATKKKTPYSWEAGGDGLPMQPIVIENSSHGSLAVSPDSVCPSIGADSDFLGENKNTPEDHDNNSEGVWF